jgi:transcriptional regulator with XRE-family HTH domain
MVRDITKDDAFADQLDRTVQDRLLLDLLMAKRAAADLSQQDIANRMNCTQGRISKLENGTDAELTIGEFQQYAKALDLEVAFGIRNRDITIAEQVKLHVFAVRKLLQQLADLSGGDEAMMSGLKVFLSEVLFNTAVSVEIVNRRFKMLVKDPPRDKPSLLAFDSDFTGSDTHIEASL